MPYFMNQFWLKQEEENGNTNGGGTGGSTGDKNKSGDGSGNQEGNSFASLEDAMKEIKRLRSENAGHRTKNKTLEESLSAFNDKFSKINKKLGIQEDIDPAEEVASLKTTNEQLSLELSLNQLARANNIPVDQDEYFRFLVGKKFEALKDGEEISEDAIKEVVAEVQKYSGFKGNTKSSTGVNDGKAKTSPSNENKETVTPEQFKKMSLSEKSKLYETNKELYLVLTGRA